jgi:hypothetical protein
VVRQTLRQAVARQRADGRIFKAGNGMRADATLAVAAELNAEVATDSHSVVGAS